MLSFKFFFFKQKTAYDMRISDWSSDVCSSDLPETVGWRETAGGDCQNLAEEPAYSDPGRGNQRPGYSNRKGDPGGTEPDRQGQDHAYHCPPPVHHRGCRRNCRAGSWPGARARVAPRPAE